MITSFIFASVGYAALAFVSILDKSILTTNFKHPAVYAFYTTIFSAITVVLLPFFGFPHNIDLLWSLGSGISFGLGVWAMYIAFRHGEASHLTPLVGAVVAVATAILSYFVLNTSFSPHEKIGLTLLIGASFFLSYEKSNREKGLYLGFLWAIISGLLFAFSHISAKHIYTLYPFINGLIWTKSSIGIVGIAIILIPRFRKQIFNKKVAIPEQSQQQPVEKQKGSITKFATTKTLGIVSTLCIQYAIAIGSVAIVNALAGLQYVLVFIFIFLLTKMRPKIFSEDFTRKEFIMQTLAIVLIVTGLLFL
ncbi:MAG: hypothetical protein WC757_01070 [Candidatus Paceibacterota bacterium]|jgi:drug/metabolite transporter (DMT)-like permease